MKPAIRDPAREIVRDLEALGIVPEADNIHHQVLERMLETASMVGLPRQQRLILAQPKNEITVHFPVRMDDGRWELFTGFRVQHNDALGPYKGGLRFHPRVTREDLKAVALVATLRSALLRLPLGGAAGGVPCDPHILSGEERMRVVRRFAAAIAHQIGAAYDIPGPDIGADRQAMAWFADTIAQMTPDASRQGTRPIVTGKPTELGGNPAGDAAVATGFIHVLREMLPEFSLDLSGLRVTLVGYGRIGTPLARLLVTSGARLTCVIDRRGGVASEKGLDPIALTDHVADEGTVCGFDGLPTLGDLDAYAHPADLLVLAAGERTFTAERASATAAGLVAEVASIAWTPQSEEVMLKRAIPVLPGMLCNAGGLVASYLEWTQNRGFATLSPREIDDRLAQALILAARRVKLARVKHDCDWRTAAIAAALEHLGRVYELRGIFP